ATRRLTAAAWQDRPTRLVRRNPNAVWPDPSPAWQAPLISEAEQNGNAFAAIWRPSRQIAAKALPFCSASLISGACQAGEGSGKTALGLRRTSRVGRSCQAAAVRRRV